MAEGEARPYTSIFKGITCDNKQSGVDDYVPLHSSPTQSQFDKLQADLVTEMEVRHSCLLSELVSLREAMLGTLRQELLGAIHGISGTGSKLEMRENLPAIPLPAKGSSDPNQKFEASFVSTVISTGPDQMKPAPTPILMNKPPEEQKSEAPPPDANEDTQNGPPVNDKDLSARPQLTTSDTMRTTDTRSFVGRPNLLAFMQCKNWDSPAIGHYQAHLYRVEDHLDDLSEDVEGNVVIKKLTHCVHSHAFDLFVCFVITVNAIVMALSLEYQGQKTGGSLGIEMDLGGWPGGDTAFLVFEHMFTAFFIVELLLRVIVSGLIYFKSGMNLLDCIIVITSALDLYAGAGLPNVTFLRLLRLTRLVKVLRVVRVLHFFDQLRVLITSIKRAMSVLAWSMVLLGIVQSAAAIFMTQSLQAFLTNEQNDLADRAQIFTFFGTFMRSFVTMFEITLAAGTWGRCGRTVIHKVDSSYIFFFIGYLSFVSFTIIRVISAIFLKETLAAAAKDNDLFQAETNRDPKYVDKLRKLFVKFDVDMDGTIRLEELDEILERPEPAALLKELGLNTHEVKGLFVLMDNGDDAFTFDEFCSGIMRLKNAPRGVDLATVLYENKKLFKRIIVLHKKIDKIAISLQSDTYNSSPKSQNASR